MKIGIDARLWEQTGVGRYIRNLVANLQVIDKENEYTLFARKEDLESIQKIVKNPKWKIIPVNIKWHSLKEQYNFPKILNRENLNLIHFPYFSVPITYKRPFIVTIHDLIVYHFSTGKASTLPLPFYKIKRIGYTKVVKNAVVKAEKIIVPLNAVKNDLIRTLNISEDKIIVTYEGFTLDSSKNVSETLKTLVSQSPYFLSVGNAYPHKNLLRLIEAFEKLKSENVRLFLVGKDDYFYKRLEKEIKKRNLNSISFLHNLEDKDISYLYQNAVSLVTPSLMEGFGLPIIEAISNNCLVLASNIPSFREVCQDTVIYFDPLSTDSIAQKMHEVLTNGKKHYKPMLIRAKKRLELFSWEKMAKETLKVYESSFSLR